ncbi:oligosaccharide flippase family protein, partial [Salmonella enterica subsp. enterica serovar Cerro]|nr:oligosaccharide flippase family protein [Salmonella enterica subsp. enterica serovar Cerro]
LFNKICYFGAKTLAIILITRSLGSTEGGQFIFLIGIVEILRVICDFGVDIYVIKRYGEIHEKNKLLITVLCQKIFMGCVFFLMLTGYCFTERYSTNIYFPASLALVFSLLFNLSNSYFQSLNENKKLTPFISVAGVFSALLLGCLYLMEMEFKAYNYLIVEILFFFAVLCALIKKIDSNIIREFQAFKFSSIIKLYKKTYSIGITAAIVIIYSRLDNIYLKIFDPQSLAVYGQVFRLVDPLVMVSSVFSTVAYAKFSNFNLRKREVKVKPFIYMMLMYVLLSSISYYIVLSIIGEWFVLPTSHFQTFVLGFLCIAGIKCLNGALTAILQSQGLYKIGLYVSLCCICLALPLMYMLIKFYQAPGAIYSIIIIESLSFILLSASVLLLPNRLIKTSR